MKSARNIALILMCLCLMATIAVGCVLFGRVMELLSPTPPSSDNTLQSAPTSSSSSPSSVPTSSATTPTTVPPSSSTAPIHKCEFTTAGNTYSPTCDMMGYTVYYCQCGKADYGDYVDSLGHVYGEYTVIPHTCTQDGRMERTCSRCGQTEKINVTEAAHDLTDWTEHPETSRKTRDCLVCGMQEIRSTVSGEKWRLYITPQEDAGAFAHLQVEYKQNSSADAQVHHVYVGIPDANIRFDYTQGYLVIYYTFEGAEKANVILPDVKNLTIQPIGTVVPGKPAAAS